ncbi:MAG: TrkA family potassium uptake protein [Chloroflexi bacterium]|nr:TrkA family potassium uptake protein [Chloroflexota bacterium]
MYIVVIGGGKVGYYLAKALLGEGHEVLIIEKDAGVCEEINEELGSISLRGDGCEAATLAEAGTERADMLIAVTGDDEDNLVSCQVSKHKFNVPRTIARLKNPQNETLFKMLGIDVTISSTNVILEHIEEEVPTHALTHLLVLEGQEIVEIKIPPEASTVGKAIRDFSLPPDSKLLLIAREKGKNVVPAPNTILAVGDRIIALTTHDTEEKLRDILVGD